MHAPRREVLTFPIKASGKDEPTLTATMRRGTRSGARPQSWQEAEAEVRKLLCSLRGTSNHLAAGDEATTTEYGSLSLASAALSFLKPLLEPGHLNTACCTQGSGVLHCFQEPCTVHMDEDNMNIFHACVLQRGGVYLKKKMSMSHQNLNWQLIIDYMHAVT